MITHLLLAATLGSNGPSFEHRFEGKVVDVFGAAVPGAEVSTLWSFPDPKDAGAVGLGPVPAEEVRLFKADEFGNVHGMLGPGSRRRALLAMDSTRRKGGLVVVDTSTAKSVVTIRLEPMVVVKGQFDVRSAGPAPGTVGAWLAKIPEFTPVSRCVTASRDFLLWLPPGEYQLMYSWDAFDHLRTDMLAEKVNLSLQNPVVDVGRIVLDLPLVAHPTGQVMDGSRPVEDAEVSTFWVSEDGKMTPISGYKTSDKGFFMSSVEVADKDMLVPLLVMDKERTKGGLATVSPHLLRQPVTIPIGPVVRVHGKLVMSGAAPEKLRWTVMYVETLPDGLRLAKCSSADATFQFHLPPGKYRFRATGVGVQGAPRDILIPAFQAELDLGRFEMEPVVVVEETPEVEAGPPALQVVETRGVESDVRPSDYKGRYLLLHFWNSSDKDCIRHSLPRSIVLYNKFREHHDEFEILGVHDSSLTTLAEIDEKMAPVIKGMWGGMKIPFPVVVDKESLTAQAYGVSKVPCTVLIDPEGNVMKGDGTQHLEKFLNGK